MVVRAVVSHTGWCRVSLCAVCGVLGYLLGAGRARRSVRVPVGKECGV